jgi:hypothetical protein
MRRQLHTHKCAVKAGFMIAGVHTLIVLVVLLVVLTLSDGTAKWGVSMGLLWTIELWAVPLYSFFGWDWNVKSFYFLCLIGGGLVYFLVAYIGTRVFLSRKHLSRNQDIEG